MATPFAASWCAVVCLMVLFPGRFILYGTDVSWTERGHRFAWRVMLNEKSGLVSYRVIHGDQQWTVSPRDELSELQHEQMRTQPDLIRQYAQHLGKRYDAAVYADAWASLNGRPSARLLDPEVDLTRPVSEGWITPQP